MGRAGKALLRSWLQQEDEEARVGEEHGTKGGFYSPFTLKREDI